MKPTSYPLALLLLFRPPIQQSPDDDSPTQQPADIEPQATMTTVHQESSDGISDSASASASDTSDDAGNRSTDERFDGAATAASLAASSSSSGSSGDAVYEHRSREHSESGERDHQRNDEAHEADGHERTANGGSGAHARRTKHDKRRKYEKGKTLGRGGGGRGWCSAQEISTGRME